VSTSLNMSPSGPASAAAQPRASALAMLPAPMSPTITVGPLPLALVEEALLQQARAFLGGDLDVPWGEQEDLFRDPLHAAVEGVGEAACEVDQSLREVGVRALEVQ